MAFVRATQKERHVPLPFETRCTRKREMRGGRKGIVGEKATIGPLYPQSEDRGVDRQLKLGVFFKLFSAQDP